MRVIMGDRANQDAGLPAEPRGTRRPGAGPPVILPLLLLAALTVLFRATDLDLELSQPFYLWGGTTRDWPLLGAEPWLSIFRFGAWPALILGFGGLAVGLASYVWPLSYGCRQAGLFLAALLALGPGLAINGYKGQCGRPRPVQVVQFGGRLKFLPVLDFGNDDRAKSFPSGHAAMGFYLMAPAFLLYRRNKRLARLFFGLGLASGTLIGLARVVQGRHFASDVVWSAGVVYLCGVTLERLFAWRAEAVEQHRPDRAKAAAELLSVEAARLAHRSQSAFVEPSRRKAA